MHTTCILYVSLRLTLCRRQFEKKTFFGQSPVSDSNNRPCLFVHQLILIFLFSPTFHFFCVHTHHTSTTIVSPGLVVIDTLTHTRTLYLQHDCNSKDDNLILLLKRHHPGLRPFKPCFYIPSVKSSPTQTRRHADTHQETQDPGGPYQRQQRTKYC